MLCSGGKVISELPLPIFGLMSELPPKCSHRRYKNSRIGSGPDHQHIEGRNPLHPTLRTGAAGYKVEVAFFRGYSLSFKLKAKSGGSAGRSYKSEAVFTKRLCKARACEK